MNCACSPFTCLTEGEWRNFFPEKNKIARATRKEIFLHNHIHMASQSPPTPSLLHILTSTVGSGSEDDSGDEDYVIQKEDLSDQSCDEGASASPPPKREARPMRASKARAITLMELELAREREKAKAKHIKSKKSA